LSAKKKEPNHQRDRHVEVHKDWLKSYLVSYNPLYYMFFANAVSGTKVKVIKMQLLAYSI
jgi:hypothetical protein